MTTSATRPRSRREAHRAADRRRVGAVRGAATRADGARKSRALALVLSIVAFAGCGEGASRPAFRHVVVVVLDTTHAAHLGCHGGPAEASPNLDALAARGVRFAEARSPATWTLPSTVSLLTGLHQESHGVVTANDRVPDDLPLLTEALRDAGRDVAFLSQMVFASARHGFDRGTDTYAYHGHNKGAPAFHAAVAERAASLGDAPTFTYLHYRRPHSPYDPAPPFLAPFEDGCPLADGSRDKALRFVDGAQDPRLDAADVAHLRHLYRGNLRQVDDRLGDVLDLLAPRLDEDTLLVVTADHGEGLGEHGDYGHGTGVHVEHVHVPLIVAGPGIAPGVVEAPVSTTDLAPTLAELLDVALPWAVDGVSLAPALRGEPVRRSPSEPVRFSGRWYPGTLPALGVAGPRLTALLPATTTDAGDAVAETDVALYRRAGDPAEERPGSPALARDAEVARLVGALRAFRALRPRAGGAEADAPTAEQLEELRELGYLK